MHLNNNKNCSDQIDIDHFMHMYEILNNSVRKGYLRSKKQKERESKRGVDEEAHKRAMADEKQKERNKNREVDEEAYRKERINEKQSERKKKQEADEGAHKRAMADEKQKQRNKKREVDEEAYRRERANEKQIERKKQQDLIDSSARIRNFKRATLFGPSVICSCCHRRLFENGVSKITEKFKEQLKEKGKVTYSTMIPPKQERWIEITLNGSTSLSGLYICHTFKDNLLRGKMPAMAVQNGLQLVDLPEDCNLTELENNLIA